MSHMLGLFDIIRFTLPYVSLQLQIVQGDSHDLYSHTEIRGAAFIESTVEAKKSYHNIRLARKHNMSPSYLG